MELGIYSFGELTEKPKSDQAKTAHERIRQIIELACLADEGGLEVFGVGEHHRHDFTISAPEVILAAIASKTKSIRLASAVTVLSSADPVRVFEQFASLDLVSDGRAEIFAGRGAFTGPIADMDSNWRNACFCHKGWLSRPSHDDGVLCSSSPIHTKG